jgi:hypothetical protein
MRLRRPRNAPQILALALIAGAAGAAEPAAPSGYTWIECPAMRARLLKPEGWHFDERRAADSDTCSVSTAPVDAQGQFETGFALTRLRDVPGRSGVPAGEFARRFLDEVERTHPVRRRSSSSQPPFEAYRAEVEATAADGRAIRIYQLAIANPATGSVYLAVFRAPADLWETSWKKIEPVIERLGLETGE